MNTYFRRGFTLIELLVVTCIIFLVAAMFLGAVGGCSRSDGSRVGTVTKFSQKGLMQKSWEGELLMGGLKTKHTDSGTVGVANVWEFTVVDPTIVPQVQSALENGTPVLMKYHQTALYNPFQRDTSYLVTGVSTNVGR